MNNKYEELISPKDLQTRKGWIEKAKIGISKLYRGTEEKPRTHRDGSKTYIDSYGRLVVEKTLSEGYKSGLNTVSKNIITRGKNRNVYSVKQN